MELFNEFNGKTILITGGDSGLGLETAKLFSSFGSKIHITGRNIEKLKNAKRLIEDSGTECFIWSHDIRDFETVKKHIMEMFQISYLDYLLNNAAGNFISRTEDLSINAFNSVIGIVLNGAINVTLEVGKRWIIDGRNGSVVNVLATYYDTGSGYVVPSAVAKSGLGTFTKSLAGEWGFKGIRINGIAPGPFRTEGAWKNLIPSQEFEKRLIERNPSGRLSSPREISMLIAFLFSEMASYVNGEILRADGGETPFISGEFNELKSITDEEWKKLREMRKR